MQLNRRNFLLGSAAASVMAGCATADVAGKPPRVRAPGEKPTLAMIGMGI